MRVFLIDNGSGIPAEVLPHIFEPFYTTKQAGAGSGLGLDIAQQHHQASTTGGSKYIRLPAAPSSYA